MQSLELLLQARRLAEQMYAGETGFSILQIRDFFHMHSPAVFFARDSTEVLVSSVYSSPTEKPRSKVFRDYLEYLQVHRQLDVMYDLLNYEGAMDNGQPTDEDRAKLRQLLDHVGIVELNVVSTKPEDSDEGREMEPTTTSELSSTDGRKVFVVHGRNHKARDAMFTFLRALGLDPIEWDEAVGWTGEGSPHISTILDHAFSEAQAVVVLMTPDDEARLRLPYRTVGDEGESTLTPQPRPNVLFEAGMAFGKHPDRTILVEVGTLRGFSDVAGRHTIRMDGSPEKRKALAQRLRDSARCPVNMDGSDWMTAGDFTIEDEDSKEPNPPTDDLATTARWSAQYYAIWLIKDLEYASVVVQDEEAVDSIEMTQDKLDNALSHAAALALSETDIGQNLATLRRRTQTTMTSQWDTRFREYVSRQARICAAGFMKIIEKKHDKEVERL